MPQIIVTAEVKDVEEWLKFKAELVQQCRRSRRMVRATSLWMAAKKSPALGCSQYGSLPDSPELPLSGTGGVGEASRDDPVDYGHIHQEVDGCQARDPQAAYLRISEPAALAVVAQRTQANTASKQWD